MEEEIGKLIDSVEDQCNPIEFKELRFELNESVQAVNRFKEQAKRNYIQTAEWDEISNRLDASVVQTNVDWVGCPKIQKVGNFMILKEKVMQNFNVLEIIKI